MPIIRRPRPHTRNFAARRFVDSAQTIGEQAIILQMYHAANVNDAAQTKCTVCWDSVYQQNSKSNCTECYGSTYENGVKFTYRSWSIWTEAQDNEKYTKRGEYQPESRDVQLEAYPEVFQHDFLIRVTRWADDGRTPLELYPWRYVFTSGITDAIVHTGGQLSQGDQDRWGQRASVSALTRDHTIYSYPISLVNPYPRKSGPPS